jgi:hypothetical protein
MMLDLHTICQLSNAGAYSLWNALNGEHELVLTSFQAGGADRPLAEMKELADLVPELSQCLVIGQRKLPHARDCIA